MRHRVCWGARGGHRRGGLRVADGLRTDVQYVGDGLRTGGQRVADGLRMGGQYVGDDRRKDGQRVGDGLRTDGQYVGDDRRKDGQRVADGRRMGGLRAERGQNFGCWGERMRVAERHQTLQSQDVHFVRQAASQRAWAWAHLVRR
jgi:hypothetical protein